MNIQEKTYNMKNLISIFILLFSFVAFAQQTPAPKQNEVITIKGATAHIGNGQIIENSVLVFENGKIIAIGDNATVSQGKIINAAGKQLYAGFIAPCKPLGIVEVDAVRASNDDDEIGQLIPNVRSLIAYNAESKVVESMRPNGVLIAQTTPRGGRISGTSSIVQLDAWNWEDAAVKVDDGIHLNWPSAYSRGRWWEGEDRGYKPNKDYNKEIDEVKNLFLNGKAFGKTKSTEANEVYNSIIGLFDGSKRLYIHTNGEKEMIDAVSMATEMGVTNPVIVGGYNAYKIIPFLKENNVPVLVNQTHDLPMRDDDNYDLPYKLPKMLVDGGLLVGIQNGDMANFQARNMAFYAGQSVAEGMKKDEALKLITSNTAKILGIDKDYGTLEVGKSATFFISNGDALDMKTNTLTSAFIDGREISLESHQTELWKRYMKKYSADSK